MSAFKIDQIGISFLKEREGISLVPYLDSAKVPTIGIGSIRYLNGKRVTMQDPPITEDMAIILFLKELESYEETVNTHVISNITQNMFNALVSFTYNEGQNALVESTLLKRVNANPQDPTIKDAFLMWDKVKVDGQLVVSQGMVNRRNLEYQLFIS